MQELARGVYAHAGGHYNDGGWDVVVECWTLDEIAEVLIRDKATTSDAALAAFKPLVDVWAERQADARNSVF